MSFRIFGIIRSVGLQYRLVSRRCPHPVGPGHCLHRYWLNTLASERPVYSASMRYTASGRHSCADTLDKTDIVKVLPGLDGSSTRKNVRRLFGH